jgi:uncharacterized protein with HEPN domain
VRDDRERLEDNLEAAERIERYSSRGRQAFDEDELIQNWMVQNLQVIGEAARALSPTVRDSNPELAWSDIIGMRTVLVHHYFEIDIAIVWSAVTKDVPILKRRVQAILDTLGQDE